MEGFKIIAAIFILAFISCQQETHKVHQENIDQRFQKRDAIEFILKEKTGRIELETFLGSVNHTCYRWKNHYVLFGESVDQLKIPVALQNVDGLEIKKYEAPLYIFDKQRHCEDKLVKEQWRDYLLTANLVEDSEMQKEYIAYHNTQFEEWPEVAKGFCNADFQQLLVYKKGRQLLLVISVPSEKTLDELNPLTVVNNPRMVEWNNIMGKYQEGIEGTKEGESWVFLDKFDF